MRGDVAPKRQQADSASRHAERAAGTLRVPAAFINMLATWDYSITPLHKPRRHPSAPRTGGPAWQPGGPTARRAPWGDTLPGAPWGRLHSGTDIAPALTCIMPACWCDVGARRLISANHQRHPRQCQQAGSAGACGSTAARGSEAALQCKSTARASSQLKTQRATHHITSSLHGGWGYTGGAHGWAGGRHAVGACRGSAPAATSATRWAQPSLGPAALWAQPSALPHSHEVEVGAQVLPHLLDCRQGRCGGWVGWQSMRAGRFAPPAPPPLGPTR